MKRFTNGQRCQAGKLLGDVIESLNPGKDELQQRVLDSVPAAIFQKRVRELLVAMLAHYFIPLTDEEAVVWLVEEGKLLESDAQKLVQGCRKGAFEQGLASTDPCHFAVEAGATLKGTIPTLGPCMYDFKHLQDWQCEDVPTEHCLVSGVPRALHETIHQNLETQLQMLATIEARWGVPDGFFSRELLPTVYTAGVALTHHNVTKQQIFDWLWVRTGTCDTDGSRLGLEWQVCRLDCGNWSEDEIAFPRVAVVALGITKALGR